MYIKCKWMNEIFNKKQTLKSNFIIFYYQKYKYIQQCIIYSQTNIHI